MSRNTILQSASFLAGALALTASVSAQTAPPRPPQAPPPPPVAPGGGGGFAGGGAMGGGGGLVAPGPRVQVGIAMGRVDDALAAHLGINPNEVVLILSVTEGGPAEAAGMKRFDVITHVNGEAPATPEAIRRAIRRGEPGDEITLRVLRGGEPHELAITLAEAPAPLRPGRALGGGFAGGGAMGGGGGRIRAVPAPPAPDDAFAAEHLRELYHQFLPRWREVQPEIEEHLRGLREEMHALRETLAREWREHVREFKVDDETREKIRQWSEGAAERIADAINRALESVEDRDIEIDIRPPRIDIFRDGAGRGMIVHPEQEARRQIELEAARQQAVEARRGAEIERRPEVERRLGELENRLERMERMMRRLLERETGGQD